MPRVLGRPLAAAVLGAALLLVAATIIGLALGLGTLNGPTTAPTLALAVGALPVGLFLVVQRPGNRVGALLCLVALTALGALSATSFASTETGAWLAQWVWWLPWPLLLAALCHYPEGRHIGRARRRLATTVLASGAVTTFCLATAVALSPALLTDAVVATGTARPWLIAAAAAMAVSVALGAWVVIDLIRRARRADGDTRSQLTALLPAGVLILAGIVVEVIGPPYATVPGLVAVPVGMGVAILAHRLDDLDLAVNRSLVWLISTLLLLAAFAAAVALLSTTTLADQPFAISVLGALAVAIGFDPVRRRVQRAVNRLLFGDRDRPHQVLVDLGRRMQASADPGGLLTDLVGTVEASLRVPYVRMEVHGPNGQVLTVVDAGRAIAGDTSVALPMLAHGEQVGLLRVAPRGRGEQFTASETVLLTDIAGQAAIAARSYRVTLELLEARNSLVRSREEERLRIRRDLHDGLGPAIAGARMQVAAARQPELAASLLASVQETLAECSQEVRRIVDGLRPGALDRGLLPALEQRIAGMGPEPAVTLTSTGDLADLAAAAEVAAYRIACEALSNAARHSGARQIDLTLDGRARRLIVEVTDNGHGGVKARDGGVGMESMRQRAEELGGHLDVDSGPDGTRIRLSLPR